MPLDPPPMEPVTVLAPSIRLTTAVVSPYSVQLTWSVTPPTKPEGKGKYELLGVTRLRLERRAGDGKPSVLSDDLGRTGGSQVDAVVQPNETYTYRLVGLTTGKDVVLESSSSVRLPDPWKLSFLAPAPGRVLATIEKFDRKLGRVVRIQHPQQEGERLGVWKDLGAKEPTPVHVVTIDGRAHEVDFDTGVTLLSVRKVEVPVVERKCRFDYIGTRKGPCSEVKDIGRFSTMAVDLSSEEADWTIYAPPPADRDRRCGDCMNK